MYHDNENHSMTINGIFTALIFCQSDLTLERTIIYCVTKKQKKKQKNRQFFTKSNTETGKKLNKI